MGLLSKIAGGANKFADELLNPTKPLGRLGAYLGAASGGSLGEATLASMRDEEWSQQSALSRMAEQARIQRSLNPSPQIHAIAGGIYSVDPETGGVSTLLQPRQEEQQPTALMQNFNWFKGLPSEDRALAAPMLPGYQFTPGGITAATSRAGSIANAQGAARAAHRAPPRPRAAPKPPAGFVLD